MLAFLLEYLHDGIRHSDDVENKLGLRMMGLLPHIKVKKNTDLDLRSYQNNANHSFTEAVNTLRTGLMLSHLEKPANVIAVTSSIPSEGKTTVSSNLAFSLAGMKEKVLLIDADMRRPSIAKNFGLPAFTPGLSNVISGANTTEECIHFDEPSGVSIMTAGLIPANPQELLSSPAFVDLLNDLKQRFDRLIIDTAPTQAVSDALIVSRHADSMLYVVKAESTRQKVIVGGLSRLMQVGARIDGVVLNQVDVNKKSGYGYYNGYYDQYGYGAENPQSTDVSKEASNTV
jgi:succinoglycan biosynthesis transport protein ExoP